jgi:hypothetical protein
VRAEPRDCGAVGTECGATIGALDLTPPSMPPHAILCVRALHDPLPAGVDIRAGRPRQRPLAWELAMRLALRTMLQRAVRPINGPVASDAEAVLFADEAELLACAARDVCRGPLSRFWWWRHVLPEVSLEHVVAAWHDAPTYMPAAFESLIGIEAATPWIQRLTAFSAATLLDAMLRAYALPALADDIGTATRDVERPDLAHHGAPVPSRDTTTPPAHRGASRPSGLAPPWLGAVPAEWTVLSLPVVVRTFAAMCIVLRRSPWLPRTEGFSRAVVSYLREEGRRPKRRNRDMVEDAVHREDVRRQPRAAPSVPQWSGGAARAESPRLASAVMPRAITTRPFSDETGTTDPDDSHHKKPVETPLDDPKPALPSSVTSLPAHSEVSSESETPSTAEQSALVSFEAFESDYAGAFFLINVAIDLELYSHGIVVVEDLDLDLWRFIEVVVREFLSKHDADDALWMLQKSLAEPARGQVPGSSVLDLSPAERVGLIGRVRTHLDVLLDVEDPGGFLIRRRGRIARTPVHLDVRFPLEHHPIEIRIARLDRNPGWIPAAGVHIGFHFD